jgi:hypothetical protein
LALARGESVDPRGSSTRKARASERPRDARAHLGSRDPEVLGSEGRVKLYRLGDELIRGKLKYESGGRGATLALHRDGAVGRVEKASDAANEGTLPRAVPPEHGEILPARDGEAYRIEGKPTRTG